MKNLKTATTPAAAQTVEPEAIATCAYHIWEQEGRPNDRDRIHWQEAEAQLRHHHSPQTQ